MKKIIIFSILLLSVIAATIGTTITTTIQIQPAYAQASHCQTQDLGVGPPTTTCITPGQDASSTTCIRENEFCAPPQSISPQEAGQRIGECHRPPTNPLISECTVRHP